MVVDDSSTIREIIQRELSKADYEVILARNGMEALAMLQWADPLPDLKILTKTFAAFLWILIISNMSMTIMDMPMVI
ncbi:MAG: hypothetical protein GY705_07080 [Bacteroidetes bacterium]|nr:hypothetical protein [Bacteroidota bacterium]